MDVVVHCAAIHPWKKYTSDQYLDWNIKGTYNLLQGAVDAGVGRVIYTSSIAAMGYDPIPPNEPPITEGHSPNTPVENLYGVTKHVGEQFCEMFRRSHKLNYVALRPPAFMPKPELERGRSLLGMYADVSDVVGAHVAAVSAPMPSRYEAFWSTNPLPYTGADAQELRDNPAAVVERYWPGIPAWFEARGATISPVPVIYDLTRGGEILGWTPKYSFDSWWKEHAHEL